MEKRESQMEREGNFRSRQKEREKMREKKRWKKDHVRVRKERENRRTEQSH